MRETTDTAREFLGTGWRFPIEPDRSGALELSRAEADIRDSLRIIIGTSKGERVMRPDFGCGIHDHVFATVNAATRNRIESSVEEAVIRWEPRVEVLSVETSTEELSEGKLLIHLEYRVRSTNTQFNLVYPFYLEES
jgi:phage baseplate assembly protein W